MEQANGSQHLVTGLATGKYGRDGFGVSIWRLSFVK